MEEERCHQCSRLTDSLVALCLHLIVSSFFKTYHPSLLAIYDMDSQGGDQLTQEDKQPPMDKKYEYLDHPADIQLHAWGGSLNEAFEQVAVSMFGYMTDIERVTIEKTLDIEVEGIDMLSLLYTFLDELLFNFCAEPNLVVRKVKILEFDRESWKIKARTYGETFRLDKHTQGTEVKAITYCNMQVIDEMDRHEVYVIVDI